MKNILFVIGCFLLGFNNLQAQCFEPDATIWKDTWVSCDKAPNPIASYGNTHWIKYDLGLVRKLSKSWVWNTNDPSRLNQGFKRVVVDYSIDGEEWNNWGEMFFPKAQGKTVYGGFSGPNLVGIDARYVLITVLENHGDPTCAGIAEIKFNLLQDQEAIPITRPECEPVEEIIVEEVSTDEAYIFWEYDGDETDGFVFEYRVDGTEEWIEIETDEEEVFLEGLTENTLYQGRVSFICEDELASSSIFEFVSKPDISTSTSTIQTDESIRLFPNPSKGLFHVMYRGQDNEILNLSIQNINGQILYRNVIRTNSGENVFKMDVSGLPDGIYLVETLELHSRKKKVEKLVITGE